MCDSVMPRSRSSGAVVLEALVGSPCPPDLDALVGRPGHVLLRLGQPGAPDPCPHALPAVESCRARQDLPLEVLVGEAVAHLDLHRRNRDRAREWAPAALRGRSLLVRSPGHAGPALAAEPDDLLVHAGLQLAASAVVAAASQPTTTTVVATAPAPAAAPAPPPPPAPVAPPCNVAPIPVGGAPYYKCGETWYTAGYASVGVVYMPVPPPPEY